MAKSFTEAFKKSLIPQIRKFRAEGWTTAEIAKELKVSPSVIEVLVREYKLPPAPIHKVSPERMKQLNDAAKAYNFKSYASIKDRPTKQLVAAYATKRAQGKPIGKGSPGVERSEQYKQTIKKNPLDEGSNQGRKNSGYTKTDEALLGSENSNSKKYFRSN
jgi:hypothetical protein